MNKTSCHASLVPSTNLDYSWGESAGAISVALQMLTNNGNDDGLFRGAIMQSGGPIPIGDIENGQRYYDVMVEKTGCGNSVDTLGCLRKVQYTTFKKAMDESPNFFAYQVRGFKLCRRSVIGPLIAPQGLVLAWMPRVDGVFLTEPPQYSVLRGHVANVPLITGVFDNRPVVRDMSLNRMSGNVDDEGTLFSFSTTNVS